MTPSVRTFQGSKIKSFQGSTSLCPRGSNTRGFSTILRVVEIDVAADILRVIAIFIITIMIPEISIIGTLTKATEQSQCEQCHDYATTCCEQSPHALGKLAISLVTEQSKEPSQRLAQTSPQYREEHFC